VREVIPIFVPFVKIEDATRWALKDYQYEAVEMVGETAYWEWFKSQWARKEPFVVVEQDVCPYPGAIEWLELCPYLWCAYRYGLHEDVTGDAVPPIGCVKFGWEFMDRVPRMFDAPATPTGGRQWQHVDDHIHKKARAAGLRCHVHFPPVLHLQASRRSGDL
jgi:hypothetical protein